VNYDEVLKTAAEQSAHDFLCSPGDFFSDAYTVIPVPQTLSAMMPQRKSCYDIPHFCSMVCYGKGTVAAAAPELIPFMKTFLEENNGYHCFDTPQLFTLNNELSKYNQCIRYTALYYLPDSLLQGKTSGNFSKPDNLEIRIFEEKDIPQFYADGRFHNAFDYGADTGRRDILAAAGYVDGKSAGIAGASNDAERMFQIGIDVIPEFRQKGIAAALVRTLADELLGRNIIPYYSCAWSNIPSQNTAKTAGFRPAWVELASRTSA
jgi:GNAT superfamily N-acetyltransferase